MINIWGSNHQHLNRLTIKNRSEKTLVLIYNKQLLENLFRLLVRMYCSTIYNNSEFGDENCFRKIIHINRLIYQFLSIYIYFNNM